MGKITLVLDREVAKQVAKRIRNPYQLGVSREAAFQALLAAIEAALETP